MRNTRQPDGNDGRLPRMLDHNKVYVFSYSVLCVGKIGDAPIATWKSKLNGIRKTINRRHADGV